MNNMIHEFDTILTTSNFDTVLADFYGLYNIPFLHMLFCHCLLRQAHMRGGHNLNIFYYDRGD